MQGKGSIILSCPPLLASYIESELLHFFNKYVFYLYYESILSTSWISFNKTGCESDYLRVSFLFGRLQNIGACLDWCRAHSLLNKQLQTHVHNPNTQLVMLEETASLVDWIKATVKSLFTVRSGTPQLSWLLHCACKLLDWLYNNQDAQYVLYPGHNTPCKLTIAKYNLMGWEAISDFLCQFPLANSICNKKIRVVSNRIWKDKRIVKELTLGWQSLRNVMNITGIDWVDTRALMQYDQLLGDWWQTADSPILKGPKQISI